MADLLRHRQTKGAATDMVNLAPPRHIPTLPRSGVSLPFSPPCACRERRAVSLRTGTRFGLPRRELVGARYSEGVRKPGPKSTKGALVHMDSQPMALLCRGRDVAAAVP